MKPGMSIDDRKIIVNLEIDLPRINFIMAHSANDKKWLKLKDGQIKNVIILSECGNSFLIKGCLFFSTSVKLKRK